MANRIKRLQQEAEWLREAEKFAAALRRTEKTSTVPRIRKRRPERSGVVYDLRLKVFEYCDRAGLRRIGDYSGPEAFLDALFRSRPLLRALIQEPKYLINLLTLYRMVDICRPTEDWRPPRSMRPERVLESYIVHHFVRYQWSKPLMAGWMEYPTVPYFLDPFLKMVKGEPLKKISHLPAKFTGRMAHYLMHAPSDLSWDQAISWAYLRGLGFSASKARHIYDLGWTQFITDVTHLPLWYFLLRYPDISSTEVRRIINFYQQQSAGVNYVTSNLHSMTLKVEALYPYFNFQGATPASVLRRVEAWEAHVDAIRNAPYTDELPPSGVKGLEYQAGNGQLPLVIRQIREPMELIYEGRSMQHCVASYLDGCVKGQCSIWVVRQANSRLATIELRDDKKIFQVKGKCNRQPEKLVMEAVEAWRRQESLLLSY